MNDRTSQNFVPKFKFTPQTSLRCSQTKFECGTLVIKVTYCYFSVTHKMITLWLIIEQDFG